MSTTRADPERFASIPDPHVDALRDALARHGYDGDMLGACEDWVPNQLDAVRMPLVLHELRRRDDAGAALARLFAYDDPITRARADELFGADTAVALLAGGLFAADE